MIRIITAGLITAGLALTPIDLAAQSGSGVISDIVQDASGGALPGATVEVVNDATGVRTATVSNEEGVYRSSGLVPGSYTLDATRSGFAAVKRGPIVLAVAQVLDLDLEPRIESVTDNVTVVGQIPLLETQTSTVTQTVTRCSGNGSPSPIASASTCAPKPSMR